MIHSRACSPFGGESVTTYSTGKKQTIVEFESLAWRYDDLFSRSRIGTQRGTVWEVLADVFRPGDAILVLNCRTREDEIFLAMLDVSVVAGDAAEGVIHDELRTGRTFDGALANFSGLHSITNFHQTARDLACLGYPGWSPHPLPFYPVLPFRNALVYRPWQISRRIP
jgi:hypothetical protein